MLGYHHQQRTRIFKQLSIPGAARNRSAQHRSMNCSHRCPISLSLSIHIMCAYRTCSIWALEGLPFHCSPHAANISNLLLSRDHFFHALLCSIYMLSDWIEGTQCVQQRERVTSLNMVNYVMMMMGRYDDIFVPFHILHFVRSFRCFFVFFYDYSVRPKWEFNVDQQQWP